MVRPQKSNNKKDANTFLRPFRLSKNYVFRQEKGVWGKFPQNENTPKIKMKVLPWKGIVKCGAAKFHEKGKATERRWAFEHKKRNMRSLLWRVPDFWLIARAGTSPLASLYRSFLDRKPLYRSAAFPFAVKCFSILLLFAKRMFGEKRGATTSRV